jgi:long-chain acyl-CoA synthetase
MIKEIQQSIVTHWTQSVLTDFKAETYTYADVAELITRLHLLFKEAGIQRGDHIALCGTNSSRWGITFLAVVSYGAVVVPILSDFLSEQIHHIVNHSESRLLFLTDPILKRLEPEQMTTLIGILRIADYSVAYAASDNSLLHVVEHLDASWQKAYPQGLAPEHVQFQPEASPNDIMMINYTSGTTGFSKGVMLPYRAFDSNYEFAVKEFGKKTAGQNILSLLPMAHMYGLMFEFLYEFLNGCHTHFLTQMPTPQVVAQALQTVKPRILVAVPLIIEKIVRKKIMKKVMASKAYKLMQWPIVGSLVQRLVRKQVLKAFGGNLYECVVGGAALNQDVEHFLHCFNFPLTVGYGATECAPIITFADWKTFAPGSCGKVVLNMEVKIDSTNPQSTPGEILARGKNVMLGYYKNPEITAATIDADGWYHTGDLGIIDAKGNLFIKGRKKNMLLGANGQNIYPEEIEDKLNSMLMVCESLVVQREGHLEALIVPDWDEANELKLTDENVKNIMELNRHDLNEMLPAYERIQAVNILHEEFEKTPKRSIKRYLYT